MVLPVSRFLIPDPVGLASIGRLGLADVPALFDFQFRLLHEENRYLCERALGLWPEADGIIVARRGMARNTLKSIARRLHHFRDWSDLSGKRWQTMRFDDVLDYQDDQSLGRGVFKRRPVSSETANARADVAVDFLHWAEHRHLRDAFAFPIRTTRSLVQSASRGAKFIVTRRSRGGRLKPSPAHNQINAPLLTLPERPAILAWLNALLDNGQPKPLDRITSKYLVCRFMLDTGVRLHEAVAVEVGQWPSTELIRRHEERALREVPIKLVVTKGSTARTIQMRMSLAKDVRRWIDTKRGALLRSGIEARRTQHTERLFLSDRRGYEGIPIQTHTVYDCFREVEPRPEGWHPHMARHAYACHLMKDIVASAMKMNPRESGPAWIDAQGRYAITLIRKQFGHVSEKTTEIYLAYLRNSIGMIEGNDHWQHDLDGLPSR